MVVPALAVLGALAPGANASDDANSSSRSSGDYSQLEESRPFALFASAGSGYGMVWGSGYANSPSGPHVLLSLLADARFGRWELDGGMSWMYSKLSGEAASGVPVSVRTRAGTFDLGLRYRVGSRWQFGPALNLAYGTDTGFAPTVGGARGTLLMGVKAVYELPKISFPFRFWAQVSTDSEFSRPLAMGLAGIQIGIPINLRGRGSPLAQQAAPRDAVSATQSAPEKEVRLVLDSQRIFFGTKSFALRPEIKQALAGVGQYLSSLKDHPSEIKIAGHADQRGKFGYNLKLSRKRAESVRDALVSGGAGPDALEVEAFSFLVPIDTANNREAWAKNRRVEIVFENVADPAALRKELQGLSADSPRDTQ